MTVSMPETSAAGSAPRLPLAGSFVHLAENEGAQDVAAVLSPASPLKRRSTQFLALAEEAKAAQWRILMLQFVLRLLDFLSINAVLPTLPGYVVRLGGSEQDYYCCIGGNAFCMMIGSFVLGAYVDGGPNRMVSAYIWTAVCTVAGSVLYAVAGSVEFLCSTKTLLVARCLVGFGASSSMLSMIYLGETCAPEERQKWVVRYGLTRSQGLFWGPVLGMALSSLCSGEAGLWGSEAMPGWFQAVAISLLTFILAVNWTDIGEETAPKEELTASEAKEADADPDTELRALLSFLAQGRVVALLFAMAVAGTAQVTFEIVVPIVTGAVLGMTGAARGAPLTPMAVMLTLGQLTLMKLTKWGMQDHLMVLIGIIAWVVVLLGTLALWSAAGAEQLSKAAVIGPFLLSSYFGPYAMLGSFSTFARLSMEDVPAHKGKCQAIQNNILAVTNLVAPAWLAWSFPADAVRQEGVPRTALAGEAAATVVALAALLTFYGALRPREEGLREKLLGSLGE